MYLYEAIRHGATLRPQHFGDWGGLGNGTCAMGAAAEAVGLLGRLDVTLLEALIARWPLLKAHQAVCPEPNCEQTHGPHPLMAIILHLNDDHRRTREAIADWLQPIEEAVVLGEPPHVAISAEPVRELSPVEA